MSECQHSPTVKLWAQVNNDLCPLCLTGQLDTVLAQLEQMRGDLAELRIAVANTEMKERMAKERLAETEQDAVVLYELVDRCRPDLTREEEAVLDRWSLRWHEIKARTLKSGA